MGTDKKISAMALVGSNKFMNRFFIKYIVIWGLGYGIGSVRAQQNIQFTQYSFNSLSINPAYAGYKEEWFAQMTLRNQWSGLDGAPKTGQISIDGVLDSERKRMGLGLQVISDKLGPQSSNSAYVNYSYRLQLNNEDTERLSFGLAAGLTQYGLDNTTLSPVDQDDDLIYSNKINSIIPDLRFGIYYYNPKWYIGASVMDMLSGDKSNSLFKWQDEESENLMRKRHYYMIGGALLNLGDNKLRPGFMIKEDFKGPASLDLNLMLILKDRFWIGGGYRTAAKLWKKQYDKDLSLDSQNSFSAIAQVYVNESFRIGYSYDYILSKLGSVQNGTHELTLGFTLPKKTERTLSPRFF